MRFLVVLLSGLTCLASLHPAFAETSQPLDGATLSGAAGCANCHTDPASTDAPYAGGRELKTPFGLFYSPNITPDKETGIGDWSEADFRQALREGIRPDGAHYFPAFPYTAYTLMTDADIGKLYRYLMALPAVNRPSKAHEIGFPFNQRWTLFGWKWLNFEKGPFKPDPAKSESWNRGAYLVEAVTHCGECHTPRGLDGGLDRSNWMAGTKDGPEGEVAPNITPHDGTGIGAWSDGDLAFLLTDGLKPDGDVVGSLMYEVIENGTGLLSKADIQAIIEYLRDQPAIENTEAPSAQPF